MRGFTRAPAVSRQTSCTTSPAPAVTRDRQRARSTPLLDLQRTLGNRAVQRMIEAAPSTVTHRYTLSAAIRRTPQDNSSKTAQQQPAPASPAAGSVRFAALPARVVPAQSDAIKTTLTYDPSITPVRPPAAPTKFGQTDTRIQVNKSSGRPDGGTFLVELVVENVITYWVAGGGKQDIASESDPKITQANYPSVVSDLTPSAAEVHGGGVDLLKNQPPRAHFWAQDLTTDHELFHAGENEKFGREGAIEARDWLDGQTAQNLDQVEALVGRASARIAQSIKTAMQPPAVEQRAYDDGAAAYTARARAIKAKGDAKGYVPQPATRP